MTKGEFNQLKNMLKDIRKNITVSTSLKRQNAVAKYNSIAELEEVVTQEKIQCSKKYNCNVCLTTKRNKCFALAKKKQNRKDILKGLPYSKVELGNMSISALWTISSHLKLVTADKRRATIVKAIYDEQVKRKMVNIKDMVRTPCIKCEFVCLDRKDRCKANMQVTPTDLPKNCPDIKKISKRKPTKEE